MLKNNWVWYQITSIKKIKGVLFSAKNRIGANYLEYMIREFSIVKGIQHVFFYILNQFWKKPGVWYDKYIMMYNQ